MTGDVPRLKARLRNLQRLARHHDHLPPPLDLIRQLESEIARSISRADARSRERPRVIFPHDLPVVARRIEIADAIAQHQVVVVCGATGSGKTTQLPKICLELGRGARGMIGHTQPRRIAARAVAQRIAHELGTHVGSGGAVGFKVRFTDQVSDRTFVKLMTDGILLAETQGDRLLSAYDTIIIDEAHERGLNIDFLLGYLKQLLPHRPDLKVIITSATIAPRQFADFFQQDHKPPVPVIEVGGRTYPVEVRYRPLVRQDTDEDDRDINQGILDAVDELSRESIATPDAKARADVLVFLPGEREIREAAEALRKHHPKNTEIIPLYARLTTEEQQRVFEPGGRRRIVLATNVAETSLTVPGIVYVIDSGLARIGRYSPRIKVQRLPIEPISRASAAQRAGRCGRTAPGVCIRLHTEDDFNSRPEFTEPEILRTNLASVILRMKALNLGEVEDFPFLQPPDSRNVRDGYDTLLELGALEGGGLRNDLTHIGAQLARLPVDPRIARMVIAASGERCLREVLVIAAALSVQDPRERPIDKQAQADEAHARFRDPRSDFLTLLNIWREFHKQQDKLSGGGLRKWCRESMISYVRVREWLDVHSQLHMLVKDMGYAENDRRAEYDPIHRALLTGLLSSIGTKNPNNPGEYHGARNTTFNIFPASTLYKGSAKWVMAAEIVRTTRTYARTVAAINPSWIESLAPHLIKRTYAEPHWDAETAQAMAYETISLYGLEIVKRRPVAYGPINPAISRTLFIQHALVNGEYLTNAQFFEHNHELERGVKRLQERTRTSDLLADQSTRFEFYSKRLPDDLASGPDFEQWRRKAEARDPRLLHMRQEDLLAPGAIKPTIDLFPDTLEVGAADARSRLTLRISYKHDPASPDDGLTLHIAEHDMLTIDLADLHRRLEWLVPGMVREKIIALIKNLPKHLRVGLVPAPDFADAALARMTFATGDLYESLTDALRAADGAYVPLTDWPASVTQLPTHLRARIALEDQSGKLIASARDLAHISADAQRRAADVLQTLPLGPFNRSAIRNWAGEFGGGPHDVQPNNNHADNSHAGALPDRLSITAGRGVHRQSLSLIPALVDEHRGGEVSIRLFKDEHDARSAHASGVRKLLAIQVLKESRSLIENTPGIERLLLLHSAFLTSLSILTSNAAPRIQASSKSFIADLGECTAMLAFDQSIGKSPATTAHVAESSSDWIRTFRQFDDRLNWGWERLGSSGKLAFDSASRVLDSAQRLALLLQNPPRTPVWDNAVFDVRSQLAQLLAPRMCAQGLSSDQPRSGVPLVPHSALIQLPRYLAAIERRFEKLKSGGESAALKDARTLQVVWPIWHRYLVHIEQRGNLPPTPALSAFRWLMEEFRVHMFAQELGTPSSVSQKRIAEAWDRATMDMHNKPPC